MDDIELTDAQIAMLHRNFGDAFSIEQRANGSLHARLSLDNAPGRMMRCISLSKGADELLEAGKHEDALAQFRDAIAVALQTDVVPPFAEDGAVTCTAYKTLAQSLMFHIMHAYNQVALCNVKLGRQLEALMWLEEAEILSLNIRWGSTEESRGIVFDWFDFRLASADFFRERVTTNLHWAGILLALRNTGLAAAKSWAAHLLTTAATTHKFPVGAPLRALNKRYTAELFTSRHPEPQALQNQRVSNPALQVRGSWAKLPVARAGRISARMGFSHFVWNRRLYVAFGHKSGSLETYGDIWYLDLQTLAAWKQLAPFPGRSGIMLNCQLAASGDRAYTWYGWAQLDYFDLVAEKWGSAKCGWTPDPRVPGGTWWTQQHYSDYAMQAVDGVLYVFGGTPVASKLGCNLFMRLDLAKKPFMWERLSGSAVAGEPAPYTEPGPRKYSTTWVEDDPDGEGKRIYLLGGMADRQAALMSKQRWGSEEGIGYEDMWSWSIKHGRWRRERLSGSPPCARAEAAFAYNEKLGCAIVFGGYSPALPMVADGYSYTFSYYADTFILTRPPSPHADPAQSTLPPSSPAPASAPPPESASAAGLKTFAHPTAGKWMHVLTQGFPTYRAQAALACDPETGRTFLFGGYTNSDCVPARSSHEREFKSTFADVWELRLDVAPPGGVPALSAEEWEAEGRNARVGTWNRCFSCAAAGPWKKCGGTCKGKAFFCDAQCLKDGWKEHKKWHSCRTK